MKKKLIYIGIFASLLLSCTESLEDKAAREAKEYTEKYCPTPYVNDSRTDSATFDKNTKVYTYYVTLRNKADNKKAIDANREKLHKLQKEALDNNPGLKKYKEAHFSFRFIYHSEKDPKQVLLDDSFKYQKRHGLRVLEKARITRITRIYKYALFIQRHKSV